MGVKNGLPSCTSICQEQINAFTAQIARADGLSHPLTDYKHPLGMVLINAAQIRKMPIRHHEQMTRNYRLDIHEYCDKLILKDNTRLSFAGHNFTKNTVRVRIHRLSDEAVYSLSA
jgi:hypothetical protein